MADQITPRSDFWRDFWAGLAGPTAYLRYVAADEAKSHRDVQPQHVPSKAVDIETRPGSLLPKSGAFRCDTADDSAAHATRII